MCRGINNFLNTFYSAVVQKMFWGTCWWMLDEEQTIALVWSPFLIEFSLFSYLRAKYYYFKYGRPSHLDHYFVSHPTGFWVVVEHCYDATEKRQSRWGRKTVWVGGVIIIIINFFLCPVSVYLRVCMEWVWLKFVCATFFFLASMCIDDLLFQRGYYAFML